MHDVEIPGDLIERIVRRRGRLHIFDDFDPTTTALVVIDMQNVFMAPGALAEVPTARGIVGNVNRLAASLRAGGGLVVWIRGSVGSARGPWSLYLDYFETPERSAAYRETLAPGGDGWAFWHELDVQEDDPIVQKDRYSAFIEGSSDLEPLLRDRGIETVAVVGTLTNSCCESTARDAMMRDFKTIMVSDANAARSDAEHLTTLCTFLNSFGDVLTTDEMLARINQRIA